MHVTAVGSRDRSLFAASRVLLFEALFELSPGFWAVYDARLLSECVALP